MAEKSFNVVHSFKEKRDAYGFALRPQHIERYREYSSIYKEEEAERSEKWKSFLERQEESTELCSSEEEFQDTLPEGSGINGSKSKNDDSNSCRKLEQDEESQHSEESSLEALGKDTSIERETVKEPQNEPEKGIPEPEEQEKDERKDRKIQDWSRIRPSLASIESMMCSRVKTSKYMNRQHDQTRSDVSSIDGSMASIEESEENLTTSSNIKKEGYEELEALIRLGVPKDLRGEVWQAFVGVKARRVERYYQDMLARMTNSEENEDHEHSSDSDSLRKWKRQIEKDIPRTFPGHPALNEDGRNSLRRILLAYACHNPSVGYCQAMNFFAGLLLLLMPEENAFWTLVGVIDEYFDGYYTEEMIESQVDQLVFEELTRERFPKLVNHLDYLGVQVAWISGPWFLSIFVNILPWESVLRVWDVLLFEGNRVMLFRTAFALMELYGPAIVTTKDAGDAITLLQTLSGSSFDSSQLVLTACMGYLSVTETRLEELRAKHRPEVVQVAEERRTRGRVWKDKKGLASKLYSFKHERSVLDDLKSSQLSNGDDLDLDTSTCSSNLDDLIGAVDSQLDSLPDLQEQVVWLKVELCRLLEEKRSAVLRAEELETALMEMVKEDNRLELNARIEQMDQELTELRQVLADKKEQETAMLQVLMKMEQEQKLTEDARIHAEQDIAAQKYATHILQEKYEKAMSQLAEMEKRVVMAESMLQATLQYESGQNKALASPRLIQSPKKKTGLLSFGFGWRNKGKQSEESNDDNTSNSSSNDNNNITKPDHHHGESILVKESKPEDQLDSESKS